MAGAIRAGLPERSQRRATRFHFYTGKGPAIDGHYAFYAGRLLGRGDHESSEKDYQDKPKLPISHGARTVLSLHTFARYWPMDRPVRPLCRAVRLDAKEPGELRHLAAPLGDFTHNP